ncbi:concanavalin A-like lectin/glucanase domain-containing protein [Cladochytrium replicatum]|nr:concanavalin A-like lectin/glucanase domain-containing protein [Cladochytrium replicatum]
MTQVQQPLTLATQFNSLDIVNDAAGFAAWGLDSTQVSDLPLDYDTSNLEFEDINGFVERFPPPAETFPTSTEIELATEKGIEGLRFVHPLTQLIDATRSGSPNGSPNPYSSPANPTAVSTKLRTSPRRSNSITLLTGLGSPIGLSAGSPGPVEPSLNTATTPPRGSLKRNGSGLGWGAFDRVTMKTDGFSVEFNDMTAYASCLSELPLTDFNKTLGTRGYHYFEMTVVDKHHHTAISVGVACKPYPPFRMIGWSKYSVGWHSDDGRAFHCDDSGIHGIIFAQGSFEGGSKGRMYDKGDTVGVGYNPTTGEVFFTMNGEMLSDPSVPLIAGSHTEDYAKPFAPHPFHIAVGASGAAIVTLNAGQKGPFKYAPANI